MYACEFEKKKPYKAVLVLYEVMCMRVFAGIHTQTRTHARTHTDTHTHTHTLAHLYTHTPGLEAVHIQSASLADVVAVQSASLVDVVAVHSVQSASLAPPEAQEADSEK